MQTTMDPREVTLKRWDIFNAMKNHAMRGQEMASFSRAEYAVALSIIQNHAHLEAGLYVQALNRLLIVDPQVRRSKRTKLWGCLLEAATAELPKRKRVNR